jgi:hypothetical protein
LEGQGDDPWVARRVLPLHPHAALARGQEPGERPGEGGLSRPVPPLHHQALAPLDDKGDVGKCPMSEGCPPAVDDAEGVDLDGRTADGARSTRGHRMRITQSAPARKAEVWKERGRKTPLGRGLGRGLVAPRSGRHHPQPPFARVAPGGSLARRRPERRNPVRVHNRRRQGEFDDPVRHCSLGLVVGHVHDRGAPVVDDPPEDVHQGPAALRVEHGRRLVREEQGGSTGQGRGDRETLELPAGERAHLSLLVPVEPDLGEERTHVDRLALRETPHDVLGHPDAEDLCLRSLEHEGGPTGTPEADRARPYDPPGRRRDAGQEPDERRLPGTVRPDDHDELAESELGRHRAERRCRRARVGERGGLEADRQRRNRRGGTAGFRIAPAGRHSRRRDHRGRGRLGPVDSRLRRCPL